MTSSASLGVRRCAARCWCPYCCFSLFPRSRRADPHDRFRDPGQAGACRLLLRPATARTAPSERQTCGSSRSSSRSPISAVTAPIVPGEPAKSELYLRVASEFAEDRMPPYTAGVELDFFQVDAIRRWIAEGADWPDDVDEREPLPAGRAAGLPAVELPEHSVVINTHEVARGFAFVCWRAACPTPGRWPSCRGEDMLITERARPDCVSIRTAF